MNDSGEPVENPYAAPRELQAVDEPATDPLQEPIHLRGDFTWQQVEQFQRMLAGVTRPEMRQMHVFHGIAALAGGTIAWFAMGPLGVVVLLALLVMSTVRNYRRQAQALAEAQAWLAVLEGDELPRTITQAGIEFPGSSGSQLIAWSSVYSYQRDREIDMLLLFTQRGAHLFPREHFASESDWTRFQRAIAKNILRMNVL